MKRGRVWLCGVTAVGGVAIASALGMAIPAAASGTAAAPVVTMFSDHGDYIGGGVAREFDGSNATVTGSFSATGIGMSVSGGTSGDSFTFDIRPPSGQTLTVGYYPGAQRAPFATAGHPGIDIYGDGRGCNTDAGWFEVRDIASSSGTITRLNLLYEQHCEGGLPALFGEMQVGEPQTNGVVLSSASITWPALGLGAGGTTVPIYARNEGASSATVGQVSLSGTAAKMFSVVGDQCSNQSLAPGGSCLLFASFTPKTRGPHFATLALPIGSVTRSVQLDGLATPGTTSLTMTSQAGDYIGQGATYDFTAANATITMSGGAGGVEQNVSAADGEFWTVDLFPAGGHVLVPGTYNNATRYPFNGSGNGLSVYGDGRGCNTLTGSFTVKQAVYSATDNSLLHFQASFVQHCEGATPALSGVVKFDAEPVVTPPPDVTNLSATASGSTVHLTWTNPTVTQWAYTVLRVQPTAAVATAPFTGTAVFEGTGTAATLTGLTHGASYAVTAFTVDKHGNVSSAEVLDVTGP